MKKRKLTLPMTYLGCVVAAAVLLLPSILRPPPDQTTQSAELSPDAPPEDEAETIIQSLRQAASRTAGGRAQDAAPPTTTSTILKPARSGCYGDPPLQTESRYSTFCAPAWQGTDNGGETHHGVFGDEIRIVWASTNDDYEGPVDAPWEGPREEPDIKRDLNVMQEYFNKKFELYGRKLRIFLIEVTQSDNAQGRAAAQRAKQEFEGFATVDNTVTNSGWMEGSIAEEMITFVQFHIDEWFARHEPYAYSFWASSSQSYKMTAEMICKQLAGKPPHLTDAPIAPTFDYDAPRVFGLMNYVDETRGEAKNLMRSELRQRCGQEIEAEVQFNLEGNTDDVASAVTRMRAAGVSTVIMANDWFTTIAILGEASAQGYFPEWVQTGSGGHGSNYLGQLYPQEQWRHAVGVGPFGIEGYNEEVDHYRAYKEMRPDQEPEEFPVGGFAMMMMIANGIQGAGPDLNPETFQKGLRSMPKRPPSPRWTLGGGYDIGDWSYIDYMTMVWWDPDFQHPGGSGLPGAYRHVFGGCMYTYDQFPTEPAPFQQSGVATPAEAEAEEKAGVKCPNEPG